MPKVIAETYRCPWCGSDPLYMHYHDTEWGQPSRDDVHIFEMLCLEGQQAGLSWITVLKKRENYRRAFFKFNIKQCAKLSDEDIEEKLQDAGLIRHRAKLTAIRTNAQAALKLQKECGSLAAYFWAWVDDRPIVNHLQSYRLAAAKTALSDQIAKDLKKRGFVFLGTTTIYAFMQSIGMVNDHETACFRHGQV